MNSTVAYFKGDYVPYENANLHITKNALHFSTKISACYSNWNSHAFWDFLETMSYLTTDQPQNLLLP